MKKNILIILAFTLGIAAYYFLPDKIEDIVLEELQEQGQRVFGTQVIVSDLSVDVRQGIASINEISIANPQGYSEPIALSLSSITAKFDYNSLVIDEIIISKPHVFAQLKGKDLNILDLANHAEQVTRSSLPAQSTTDATATKTNEETQESEDEPLILTINLIALENATIDIQSDLTDKTKQLSIERLEARNLQGNSQQLANQLAKGLFNDLAKQVITESANTLEDEALEKLKDKAKEKLKKLFSQG